MRTLIAKYRRDPWPSGQAPVWPDEGRAPWREEDRPSLVVVTFTYPSKALGVAFFATMVGGLLACLVVWGVYRVFHVLLWGASAAPVFLIVIAAVWWELMNGLIRGWWTFGGDA